MMPQPSPYEMQMQSSNPVSADRAIQMIAESEDKKNFLYRTLFGNKQLPHVVFAIEHITTFYPIVNPVRRRTLQNFHEIFKNTLISTTSIEGKTWSILTEQKIKHTHEEGKTAKKGGFGGLFGG